jgi:hypothetical protein
MLIKEVAKVIHTRLNYLVVALSSTAEDMYRPRGGADNIVHDD